MPSPLDALGLLVGGIGGIAGGIGQAAGSAQSFANSGPNYQRPITDPHDALYNAMQILSSLGSQQSQAAMKPVALRNGVAPTPSAPRNLSLPTGDMTIGGGRNAPVNNLSLPPTLTSDPFSQLQSIFAANNLKGLKPTAKPLTGKDAQHLTSGSASQQYDAINKGR